MFILESLSAVVIFLIILAILIPFIPIIAWYATAVVHYFRHKTCNESCEAGNCKAKLTATIYGEEFTFMDVGKDGRDRYCVECWSSCRCRTRRDGNGEQALQYLGTESGANNWPVEMNVSKYLFLSWCTFRRIYIYNF